MKAGIKNDGRGMNAELELSKGDLYFYTSICPLTER